MGIKRGGVQRKAQLQMHRAVELGTGHAAFSQGFAGYDLGFHPPHGPPIGGICLQVRNAGGGWWASCTSPSEWVSASIP